MRAPDAGRLRALRGGARGMRDGAGSLVPARALGWGLAETVVRSLLLVGALFLIGLAWEALA